MTLKIESRSPNFINQLFSSSQYSIYVNLVKIHPLVQNNTLKPYFGLSKCRRDLKKSARSPKSYQLFPSSQQCIYASLVEIHPLVHKITLINSFLDMISKCRCTLTIRSRSPKSSQLFPSSHQCIYASLVKIHPLVQKIRHGNHISNISKCCCDLENKVKVTKISSTFPPFH